MAQRLKHIILLLLVLLGTQLRAQTYPVQSFVQVTPPYNSYLPDYADPFTNQMRVLLTLTDFSVPSTQVKLRFSIEGPGYSMQSVDLIAFPTITLTPGVPVEISGADLAPYLQTENLVFSGLSAADYELSKVLPEGPATICVEVVDVISASQPTIGNPSCGQTWFSLYDPPLLNLPFCETEITPVDPQAVLFSWTPLHMASPLSGSTEYIFELFEIRPEMGDPNVVVNSSLPIYSETTTFTYINYGIVQPQLQVGLSYVWRVKARDASGRDLYRNQGYSTVCTFTYGSIAGSLIGDITLELNANGTGVRQGLTWWNASDLFDNYTLEVRKTGNPDFEWFPYTSTTGELKVNSLEPSTEYECRVKGVAGGAETDWSNTATFTTQPPPNYACGSQALPAVSPLDQPLEYLLPGNIVAAGQFEMTVTSAEPVGYAPGHFRGTGKIHIPFMLTNINVEYEDIYVDDNMTMRSGRVEAMTDGIEEWLANMETIFIDGIINQPGGFEFNEDSTVTVYFGGMSLTFEFNDGEPLVFEDESGLIYTVNADGTFTVVGGGEFVIELTPFELEVFVATFTEMLTLIPADSITHYESQKSVALEGVLSGETSPLIEVSETAGSVVFISDAEVEEITLTDEEINLQQNDEALFILEASKSETQRMLDEEEFSLIVRDTETEHGEIREWIAYQQDEGLTKEEMAELLAPIILNQIQNEIKIYLGIQIPE